MLQRVSSSLRHSQRCRLSAYFSTKSTEPLGSNAILCFPGQGFQSPGMLYELQQSYPGLVNPILESLDKSLEIPLSRYLVDKDTDPDIVNLTTNAQPLLLTASYTYFQILQHYNLLSTATATKSYMFGHSLGEFTAWTAAGLMSFNDAVWLVRQRGKAMERATADAGQENGMTVLMISEKTQFPIIRNLLERLVQPRESTVSIANINSSNQLVLSGVKRHITEIIAQLSEDMGKRMRTRSLAVSGAFHSPLMAPGKLRMQQILGGSAERQIQFSWPLKNNAEVISNITAKPFQSLEEVKSSIINTLCTPVDWLGSIEYLNENAPGATLVCFGPGRVIKTAAKDTNNDVVYVDSVEAIETLRASANN